MNALLTYLSFAATLTLTLVVNYLFIYKPVDATLNLLIGKLDAVQAKLETPLVARDETRAQPVPGPLAAQPFPSQTPPPSPRQRSRWKGSQHIRSIPARRGTTPSQAPRSSSSKTRSVRGVA